MKSLPCSVVLPISGSEQILPLNLVTAKHKKKLTAKVILRIVETLISRESWPLTPASGSLSTLMLIDPAVIVLRFSPVPLINSATRFEPRVTVKQLIDRLATWAAIVVGERAKSANNPAKRFFLLVGRGNNTAHETARRTLLDRETGKLANVKNSNSKLAVQAIVAPARS
ncbi:MAG TPA: hypothetical protein EYG31_02545 [Porticoccaceae bacterium]|nr:hypothetical protein [Gammaproteobacteria bacterium]HIL59501.1 hypothetical protein [Porticoccaceae bacterium]